MGTRARQLPLSTAAHSDKPSCAAAPRSLVQVEGVELVRAYGRMLKLVLARGKLLQQLQSAIAALQQAADAHTSVPAALESACHDVKEKVAKVDAEIQVGSHKAAQGSQVFINRSGLMGTVRH